MSTMEYGKILIKLKIKRFDLSDDPETVEKTLETYNNVDYSTIANLLFSVCETSPDKTVLKIRNDKGILVPISFLIEQPENCYCIDVATISCFGTNSNSLLQDAYVDAVCNKVKSLESRIAQTELLLPQLEWRRQAYMEDTVSSMLNKVQFLNRRFDELYPKYCAGKKTQNLSP